MFLCKLWTDISNRKKAWPIFSSRKCSESGYNKRSKNEFCSSWANVSHNIEGPRKNLTERKLFSFPEIIKNYKIYAMHNQKEPCRISFRIFYILKQGKEKKAQIGLGISTKK